MNKFITLVSVIVIQTVFSVGVFAKEIKQGTFEVSGDFDLSFSSTETDPAGGTKTDTDRMGIASSVSYYFAPNIGLGLVFNYQDIESTTGTSSIEVTSKLIGPQVHYSLSLNETTNLRLSGAVFISSTKLNNSSFTTEFDGTGWSVQGRLGYFLSESVSFNGGLTYSALNVENDSTNTDSDTKGLSIGLGISVYFK